ncbi:polyamine aminopropyltransferase [Candidatus Dependentiae bacterium]|nr:polyamine aminopropyltransferase [Candidatus Dependentiae bacterium]
MVRLSARLGAVVCSFMFSLTSIQASNKSVDVHELVSMESIKDLKSVAEYADRERLGHHLIIDLSGCNPEKIKQVTQVESILLEAAQAARATVVASKFHQFNPVGVSGALVLAESHLTIHTWPEVDGYCAIDIFTCGSTDNFAALEVMKKRFEAKNAVVVEIERGKEKTLNQDQDTFSWFRESLDPLKGFQATVKTKALLDDVDSDFQNIKMYDTVSVGKMMVIDGIIQYTDYDNHAYHEMIVHVPMQAHPNPRKVLIIGGGDGGALAEVNKYRNVEEIVICDIDQKVSEIACKYSEEFATAYKDPRVRAVFQDGTALVSNFKNYFDVIIVDCTDFYGVAAALARKEFYDNIKQALTDDGVMVIQAESIYYDREFIAGLYKQTGELFPVVDYYYTLVPTYPSGTIGFVFGSKKYSPTEQLGNNPQQLDDLKYYTPQVHVASFALPAFIKKLLV